LASTFEGCLHTPKVRGDGPQADRSCTATGSVFVIWPPLLLSLVTYQSITVAAKA
jgi:hypothetical protein